MDFTGELGALRCKAMAFHAFEPFTPVDQWNKTWRDGVSLRCIYCGTERYDILNLFGKVMTRRYKHPEGYERSEDISTYRVQFYETVERMRNAEEASQ